MNKSNLLLVLYITIFQIGITAYSQKVSNITFRQEQSTIIVSYDLETKTPCKVSLYVSTNGGVKWQGPLTKVTGDFGSKVVSGSHNITWNVLDEFEELKGDNIKFQVKAIGSDIETIKIGTQEWMAKNLDVSKYRNGDIIPEVKDADEWANLTTGAWCYYNNNLAGAVYGKLYNWYAVNDPRGLAPDNFHIPTDSELKILITSLGGESLAGGKMKTPEIGMWWPINTGATNESYFAGLPGGSRYESGIFDLLGSNGNWWSSSEFSIGHAWFLVLYNSSSIASRFYYYKTAGFSVRCIKD
jgi:uncharacterized protein (TIGR02145 family)